MLYNGHLREIIMNHYVDIHHRSKGLRPRKSKTLTLFHYIYIYTITYGIIKTTDFIFRNISVLIVLIKF